MGHTPKGWNKRVSDIVMHTGKTRNEALPWRTRGAVDIGSVNVDGEVFDRLQRSPVPSQSHAGSAVRRSQTWSGSVNLRKIFDYWRSQGWMANEYVVGA